MSPTDCPVCLAMVDPGFRSLPADKAIEVAFLAGMAVAVSLVAGHTAAEAREQTKKTFCAEHANDLFVGARAVVAAADSGRGKRPS